MKSPTSQRTRKNKKCASISLTKNWDFDLREGLFLSGPELDIFDSMHASNLRSYVRMRRAFRNRNSGWILTNRTELFKILGHRNIRSVYNVLHRFRKKRVLEVRFQSHRGILIRFSMTEGPDQEPGRYRLVLRPGEKALIQAEEAKCI